MDRSDSEPTPSEALSVLHEAIASRFVYQKVAAFDCTLDEPPAGVFRTLAEDLNSHVEEFGLIDDNENPSDALPLRDALKILNTDTDHKALLQQLELGILKDMHLDLHDDLSPRGRRLSLQSPAQHEIKDIKQIAPRRQSRTTFPVVPDSFVKADEDKRSRDTQEEEYAKLKALYDDMQKLNAQREVCRQQDQDQLYQELSQVKSALAANEGSLNHAKLRVTQLQAEADALRKSATAEKACLTEGAPEVTSSEVGWCQQFEELSRKYTLLETEHKAAVEQVDEGRRNSAQVSEAQAAADALLQDVETLRRQSQELQELAAKVPGLEAVISAQSSEISSLRGTLAKAQVNEAEAAAAKQRISQCAAHAEENVGNLQAEIATEKAENQRLLKRATDAELQVYEIRAELKAKNLEAERDADKALRKRLADEEERKLLADELSELKQQSLKREEWVNLELRLKASEAEQQRLAEQLFVERKRECGQDNQRQALLSPQLRAQDQELINKLNVEKNELNEQLARTWSRINGQTQRIEQERTVFWAEINRAARSSSQPSLSAVRSSPALTGTSTPTTPPTTGMLAKAGVRHTSQLAPPPLLIRTAREEPRRMRSLGDVPLHSARSSSGKSLSPKAHGSSTPTGPTPLVIPPPSVASVPESTGRNSTRKQVPKNNLGMSYASIAQIGTRSGSSRDLQTNTITMPTSPVWR